ncbi:DUF1990 domain-containing protein [Solwaraspora sp. WMMD406]|uniref:DUF1990 family protein n=1 Tax=Solwaraspora sp. WMMD406 TaxID=3016095 RepID=UPI002417A5EC|nr:DUF1990 domain-containing protein [Solwaraspora sp. WMMD406]MDG4766976.1 DUF1990 domain-containing protein [Solwaraspora sp. WMMD406]
MPTFTYPDVGATRHAGTDRAPAAGADLPSGYRHLHYRTRLRSDAFTVAADAVLTWRMHRRAGARIAASAPRADPGVLVTVGLGVGRLRMAAPCAVVWTATSDERAGFAYGTLPGHPASGEEAFIVERTGGEVWFAVVAFSRPVALPMRMAGPVGALFQYAYARRCGQALRRLTRSAHPHQ